MRRFISMIVVLGYLAFVPAIPAMERCELSLDEWLSQPVFLEYQHNPLGCAECTESVDCRVCNTCGTVYFNIIGSHNGNSLFHPFNMFYGQPDDLAHNNGQPADIFIQSERFKSAGQYYGYTLCMALGKSGCAHEIRKGFGMNLDWYVDNAVHLGADTLESGLAIAILKKSLLAKFGQHPWLRQLLIETGSTLLVFEAETLGLWGSRYKGKNLLGTLLMELRQALQSGSFVSCDRNKRERK